MLDQTLGLLDHHFGDLDVAGSRLSKVEDTTSPFTELHVGHFFRTLIDQENDEIGFRVIGRDRCNVLQQDRLTGTRRRDDQTR